MKITIENLIHYLYANNEDIAESFSDEENELTAEEVSLQIDKLNSLIQNKEN